MIGFKVLRRDITMYLEVQSSVDFNFWNQKWISHANPNYLTQALSVLLDMFGRIPRDHRIHHLVHILLAVNAS